MINLEKWNPEWSERFATYEASLTPLFPGTTLHHIGATSIRGLSAQPIIDMLLLVKDEASVWSAIDTLVDQGYTYIGTERNTETLFNDGMKMYVTQVSEPAPLLFRDILAADPRVMWAYKQVKESAAPRGELAYKAAKGNFVEAVIRAYKQGTKATPSACCKRTVTCDAMSGNRQRSESTQETSGGVPVETAGDEKDNEQVENNGEEPDSGDEEYQTVLAQEMDSSTVQDSLSNEEAGNCEILYSPPERALDTGQETDTCSEQSPITIQRGPFRKEKPALSQEVPTDMHSINDFSPLLFCGKCGKPLFADSGRYAGVYYKFWVSVQSIAFQAKSAAEAALELDCFLVI